MIHDEAYSYASKIQRSLREVEDPAEQGEDLVGQDGAGFPKPR